MTDDDENRQDRSNEMEDRGHKSNYDGDDDDDDNDHVKLRAAPDFDGPVKDRHCTDVFCMLLLVASWVAMTGVGIYAMANGNIDLIIRPLDYDGNVCGTNFGSSFNANGTSDGGGADMTDYPFLLYLNSYTGGVCVKECPDLSNRTQDGLTDMRTLITYGGIWQVQGGGAELPLDYIQMGDYSQSSDALTCGDNNDVCFPNDSIEESWTSAGINEGYGFAYYAATTYELLYRCYITPEAEARIVELTGRTNSTSSRNNNTGSTVGSSDATYIDDVYTFWGKLYGDIYISRHYILGFGFGLSTFISLVYIFLMRLPFLLTAIIWTSIFMSIAMFFVGGYYAWSQASIWEDEVPQVVMSKTIHLTSGFAIGLFAVGGLLILLACCLRQAIMDAIKCTKEAGKAVNSMILILLVPVLQSLGFLAFMFPFLYYAAYLASLGKVTTVDVPTGVEVPGVTGPAPEISYRVYDFDDFTENCAWYLLFCFFWTANFIVAMGDVSGAFIKCRAFVVERVLTVPVFDALQPQLIIAVSVAKWYFTKNKATIGSWTVLGSIIDVCWYHAGTAAFGSLLVAIVQIIRAMIAKAQKEAEKADNKLAKCVLCCCQCCFWCLETLLKFINKNAYVQTAIFSTSFCKSCRKAFALIFRNAARVAALTYVSSAVLIVGKLFISSVVTVAAYYFMLESIGDELYSIGGPICIIFLISYFISDMFMDVLDMGISTVLHCFIADEEMFDGDNRYHEESLKEYVDMHGKEE